MLDLKKLRSAPQECAEKIRNKGIEVDLSTLLELDEKIRFLKTHLEELQAKRNAASKEIGYKKQKGEPVDTSLSALGKLSDEVQTKNQELAEREKELQNALSYLPNLPLDEIPVSLSAKDNVCIKQVGEKTTFSFPFKNHVELNEKLKLFDFERGAKISGSGWPIYRKMGARLEWALLNYMLDIHVKNGFTQIIPPLLVRPETMFGSGQLPKFESQLFKLHDPEYFLYLIPTAEVPIAGLHKQETIDDEELPLKYTAYTPCFRREAGAAGSQERGLIRMHQFNKVELFCLAAPELSEQAFNEMLSSAEEVLQGLDLPYRNMLLTTGDMSFAAAKTIDIEVWLPGQNRYYEVSSVSHCTDFQSRRLEIRAKKKGEKGRYLHTLNGSGLATSRLMVALLENHQQPDGSVLVPKALHPYLGKEITSLTPCVM